MLGSLWGSSGSTSNPHQIENGKNFCERAQNFLARA
jgi:hypothetical protein